METVQCLVEGAVASVPRLVSGGGCVMLVEGARTAHFAQFGLFLESVVLSTVRGAKVWFTGQGMQRSEIVGRHTVGDGGTKARRVVSCVSRRKGGSAAVAYTATVVDV